MDLALAGTPSDVCPPILATGKTDAQLVFPSLSRRVEAGRDAEYLAWHTMDHRPEQYRIAGLRHSLRVIPTPACRAARAASVDDYDDVDHTVAYMFTGSEPIAAFHLVDLALLDDGRFEHRLPPVGFAVGDCQGRAAAPRAVVGPDVVPWRPMTGLYLIIEEGRAPVVRSRRCGSVVVRRHGRSGAIPGRHQRTPDHAMLPGWRSFGNGGRNERTLVPALAGWRNQGPPRRTLSCARAFRVVPTSALVGRRTAAGPSALSPAERALTPSERPKRRYAALQLIGECRWQV